MKLTAEDLDLLLFLVNRRIGDLNFQLRNGKKTEAEKQEQLDLDTLRRKLMAAEPDY